MPIVSDKGTTQSPSFSSVVPGPTVSTTPTQEQPRSFVPSAAFRRSGKVSGALRTLTRHSFQSKCLGSLR